MTLKPQLYLRSISKRVLPVSARRKIKRMTLWPPVGMVRFGGLRRLKPISRAWGADRGLPVDRYYIEEFLQHNAHMIRGNVLEIKEDLYTTRFGGNRVTKLDVLHREEGNPAATIVGDLTCADHIAPDTFDCIILTQTLHLIYDVHAVVRTLYRILKPGGAVLVTIPGITRISREDMERWGQCWTFTTYSTQRLFEEVFPPDNVRVVARGNVVAAIALLHGLSAGELHKKELDYYDPDYQTLISTIAVKPNPMS